MIAIVSNRQFLLGRGVCRRPVRRSTVQHKCRATVEPASADGGTKGERHRAFDGALAVHARNALEQPHAAAQTNHGGFDDDHVARSTGRRYRTRSMPAKKGRRCRFSGLASTRIAPNGGIDFMELSSCYQDNIPLHTL